MSEVTPSDEQAFDFLLMGLTWLRRYRPDILARPAASIFGAMQSGGVLSDTQRKALGGRTGLISLVMSHGRFIKGRRRPRRQEMDEIIQTSDKLIVVLVVPSQDLQFHRLLGGPGYPLVVTEAGMAWADRVAGEYAELIDSERFLAGAWPTFTTVARAMAIRRRTASKATSTKPDADEEEDFT